MKTLSQMVGWRLPCCFSRAAERYALVHGDVAADDGRFADDNSGGVIDEEPRPEKRARMNIDARIESADLRKDARAEAQLVMPQPMRNAMNPHGPQPRIAEQNFEVGARSRIALHDRTDIIANSEKQGHRDQGNKRPRKREGLRATRSLSRSGPFVPLVPCSLPFLRRHRNRLGLQSQRLLTQRLEQHAGQVALAEVGQHSHDQLTFIFRPRGNLQGSTRRRAGADADEQAFFLAPGGAPSPPTRRWLPAPLRRSAWCRECWE